MRRVEVTVLDEDAIPLTRATANLVEPSGHVVLEELSAPGALLDYYFGRGERTVMLQAETVLTVGTVETSWDRSERRWEVWLESSTPGAPIVDPEPELETQAPPVRLGHE